MLAWADFMNLLILALGPLSSVVAAHYCKAGLLFKICAFLGGLALSYLVASLSSKVAWFGLCKKGLNAVLREVLYMVVPVIALLFVIVVPLSSRRLFAVLTEVQELGMIRRW